MRFRRIELIELPQDVHPEAEREPAEPQAAREQSSQVNPVQAQGSFVDEGDEAAGAAGGASSTDSTHGRIAPRERAGGVALDAQARAAGRQADGACEGLAQHREEEGPGLQMRSATACVALCPACKVDGQRIGLNLTPHSDADAPATWRHATCPWCGWQGTVNVTGTASGVPSPDGDIPADVARAVPDASTNQWPSA